MTRWYGDRAARFVIDLRYVPWLAARALAVLTALLGVSYTVFSEWMNVPPTTLYASTDRKESS